VPGAERGQEVATLNEGLSNARIELSLTADGGVTFGINIPSRLKRSRSYCFFPFNYLLLKILELRYF
jgi:hypothetical protein